jgi:hypothetical protein
LASRNRCECQPSNDGHGSCSRRRRRSLTELAEGIISPAVPGPCDRNSARVSVAN